MQLAALTQTAVLAFVGVTKNATHGALSGSPQTPPRTLGLVAAGDPAAVRQCIVDYGPLVWAIARRFSPTEAEAADAVQEIFVELWKHAGRYDPKLASEPAFVTMIARRRMIDRLGRVEQRAQRRPAPDTLAGTQQGGIDRCAEAKIAEGVLASLDPQKRRVLSLAIGQGMTYAETARAAAMPVDAVKSLVRRALVAVRKRLLARGGERR